MTEPYRTLRQRLGAVVVAALLVVLSPLSTRAEALASEAEAPQQPTAGEGVVGARPAELKVANREIVTLRAGFFGASPADRVEAIGERIEMLIARGGPMEVSTREIEGGYAVLMDGDLVFRVLDADAQAEIGETAADVAARAADSLRLALQEISEGRSTGAIVNAVIVSLIASAVLFTLLWGLVRAYGWAARKIRSAAEARVARLEKALGQHATVQLGIARIAVAPLRVVAILLAVLAIYEWLGVVLKQFPYTRPWGEALLSNLLNGLGKFVLDALHAVPGLLFVLLIFVLARFFVRVLQAFFASVEQGRVHLVWVDETTARPTGKLLSAAVWLLALVAAYPYIPGSDSEAFKGIGVFVGLMLSIGSSGVVNQAVSGLMLMYTRSFKPGEFVKVGETEGVVKSIGFLTTQIETLRKEVITIPNAVIVGNTTRNYSRSREQGGVRIATAITIGYDAPWRQVQAMLHQAVERTEGVLKVPPSLILQTALLDHAVEYTVIVGISDPTTRPAVLDELHAQIQDVFNEHGVQIMSPHYIADPEVPKTVPRDEWYRSPAASAAPATPVAQAVGSRD
jgi:small-conductance mechanosensitive channel